MINLIATLENTPVSDLISKLSAQITNSNDQCHIQHRTANILTTAAKLSSLVAIAAERTLAADLDVSAITHNTVDPTRALV